MSRSFVAGNESYIDFGDAFRFESAQAWSLCLFARLAGVSAADERTLISKYGPGSSSARQFRLRVNNGSAPGTIETDINDVGMGDVSDVMDEDTWYLIAVTNDGSGGTDGVSILVYDLDGTLAGSAAGTHASDATTLSTSVWVGTNTFDSVTDDWDGDVAHVAYFDSEFSESQLLAYMRNPGRVAAQQAAAFYAPLIGASTEPDWSGNGHNGTLYNSPGISDMPPGVAPAFAGWSASASVPPPAIELAGSASSSATVVSVEAGSNRGFGAATEASGSSATADVRFEFGLSAQGSGDTDTMAQTSAQWQIAAAWEGVADSAITVGRERPLLASMFASMRSDVQGGASRSFNAVAAGAMGASVQLVAGGMVAEADGVQSVEGILHGLLGLAAVNRGTASAFASFELAAAVAGWPASITVGSVQAGTNRGLASATDGVAGSVVAMGADREFSAAATCGLDTVALLGADRNVAAQANGLVRSESVISVLVPQAATSWGVSIASGRVNYEVHPEAVIEGGTASTANAGVDLRLAASAGGSGSQSASAGADRSFEGSIFAQGTAMSAPTVLSFLNAMSSGRTAISGTANAIWRMTGAVDGHQSAPASLLLDLGLVGGAYLDGQAFAAAAAFWGIQATSNGLSGSDVDVAVALTFAGSGNGRNLASIFAVRQRPVVGQAAGDLRTRSVLIPDRGLVGSSAGEERAHGRANLITAFVLVAASATSVSADLIEIEDTEYYVAGTVFGPEAIWTIYGPSAIWTIYGPSAIWTIYGP